MATQIMKNNINPIEYFTILGLNEIVKYLNLYILLPYNDSVFISK